MDYIINGKVIVSQDGMRTIGALETEIFLTPIPVRLLIFLIEHNNIAMTRDEILYAVWTSFGLVPSGTSLSQHISKLRKCFREFDIDENIIKTLPQKGIIFTGSVKPVNTPLLEKKQPARKNIWFKGWHMIMILLCIAIGAMLFHYYHTLDGHIHKNPNYAEWYSLGKFNSCEVLTQEKNMEESLKKYYLQKTEEFISSHKIDCNEASEILVDLGPGGLPVNQELSGDRKFFSYCQKSNDEYQCNNFYYSVGVTQ